MATHHGGSLIHIAIAEDQAMFLQTVSKIINEWDDCKVILQARNGKELLEKINPKNLLPDIVITDLRMPEMDGYATTRELKRQFPELKIIVLSMYEDKECMLLLLKAGANGFINKKAEVPELRKAIHDVMNKGYYFADHSIARIFKQIMDTEDISGIETLNDRELNYLKFLCMGKQDKEIANSIGITERKAEEIRYNLFERFAVQNRTELAIQSIERGIIV